MGLKVNQTQLAEIIGVDDTTLWEWQKDGLPIEEQGERGKSNRYDTAAVIEWLRAREKKAAPTSAKDRLIELQVEKETMVVAQLRGTLVPVEEVEPAWRNLVLTAAAYMASRASRLAGVLEATPGIEAKRAVLKKEDAEFLTKLGVDGERMERELQELLSDVSAEKADAFLRRIAGHEHKPDSEGGAAPDLGAPGPA